MQVCVALSSLHGGRELWVRKIIIYTMLVSTSSMERLLTLLFELEKNRQQNVENKQIGSFNSLLT